MYVLIYSCSGFKFLKEERFLAFVCLLFLFFCFVLKEVKTLKQNVGMSRFLRKVLPSAHSCQPENFPVGWKWGNRETRGEFHYPTAPESNSFFCSCTHQDAREDLSLTAEAVQSLGRVKALALCL